MSKSILQKKKILTKAGGGSSLSTPVSVANGGTGLSSYTVGDLIYASGTTTLSKLAIGTANQQLRVNAGATALEYFTPTSGGITVGTTTITGGATGLILYQKSDGTVQASELKYASPTSTYAPATITVGSGVNHVIKFVNAGGRQLMNLEEGVALGELARVDTSFSTYKVAIGQSATATGSQSTAIGALSSATQINSLVLGYAATSTAANQCVIGAAAAAGGSGVYDNVYFNGVTFTSAASVNLRACGGSGSNNVAANLNLYAGLSTGSGTPATVGLYSSAAGASSSTAQTAVKVLEITNSTTITTSDAVNYALGSTTGTKFGTTNTQKLAFWNSTPVVQQILATGAAATVDDVITLLQTLGLCKQS